MPVHLYEWRESKSNDKLKVFSHVSLELVDNTYISWWKHIEDVSVENERKEGTGKSYKDDMKLQSSRRADQTYRLEHIDDQRVKIWWNEFLESQKSKISMAQTQEGKTVPQRTDNANLEDKNADQSQMLAENKNDETDQGKQTDSAKVQEHKKAEAEMNEKKKLPDAPTDEEKIKEEKADEKEAKELTASTVVFYALREGNDFFQRTSPKSVTPEELITLVKNYLAEQKKEEKTTPTMEKMSIF